MSQLYIKVQCGFYTHRKTLRLSAAIGDAAFWIPPRLWAYAAENQADGIFEDYSPKEIATLIGYSGDASTMLQALLRAGFMDDKPLRIHDWESHNGFHKTFADRAKKGAVARWARSKQSPSIPSPHIKEIDTDRETSIASSNACSIPSPKLSDARIVVLDQELKRITKKIDGVKLSDYAKGTARYEEIVMLRKREKELRGILGIVG